MADEIERCNEIRPEYDPATGLWRATVGPDRARGLTAPGFSAPTAVINLMARCEALGWVWDESWRDRGRPGYGPMVDH